MDKKYIVVLLLAVLFMSGCVSGRTSCVTDCRYEHADDYFTVRDGCIDDTEYVYNDTIGVYAYCVYIADAGLDEDCARSCVDIKR
ncbi:hypothetical protein GQ472_01615 [archaeon]|nr:hypothetical protein [archaeon]